MTDAPLPVSLTPEQLEEATALLKEARSSFFKLAEQSIRIQLDVPRDIHEEALRLGISDRLYFADLRIRDITQLCENTKEAIGTDANGNVIWEYDKLAQAKLAGAYVNKMGVLAEESLQRGFYYRSPPRVKGVEPNPQETVGGLYMLAGKLLHHVRLHNGKNDLDKVLSGQLGEVFKACIGIERALSGESFRVRTSVAQMKELIGWMKDIVALHSRVYPPNVMQLLDELGKAAQERLTMPLESGYEHLNIRDASDVSIRHRSRRLREYVHAAAVAHEEISVDAHDLERGSRLIEEMVEQLEKPLSLAVVKAIRQLEKVAATLEATPGNAHAAPLIHKLMTAQRKHMEALLRLGKPNPLARDNFEKACRRAKAGAVQLPETLRAAYLKGIDAMYGISPAISANMVYDVNDVCSALREQNNRPAVRAMGF